ncbi:MFS transporter [Agreia pratensis]|uniref:MFS transporter n=1 Tax=Agreia pratensis TaxID=150121 RepID=UPI00188B042F|nr:MFS transporter [Agreia pratensis]MBF4635298.1 MFS transporter [Agreia pratensis]
MSQDRFDPRSLSVLIAVVGVNLLGIIDTTIVSIAIPSASDELGLDAGGRQWVVTAYALAFGAVLLIGGRIADYWGRKKTLILGVLLFCLASTWGGFAQVGLELVLARALQGAGAALMAPAALSIVTLAYPSGRTRAIAFGALGGISSGGAALGLILGGVLTETVGWRWCLLVNVPVGVVAIVLAAVTLRESRASGPARYDVWGAVFIATGLGATTYGLTRLGEHPTDPVSLGSIVVGAAFIVLFVIVENRTRAPILPLTILLNRARGGALLVQICAGTVMASVTLYATLHLQQVLLLGPMISGVAMVPLALGIAIGIPFFVRISGRIGLRWTLVVAPLLAGLGIAFLASVSVGGSYWLQLLPGLVIMGFGMAGVFVAAQNLALLGVAPADAGAASAASQAAGQVGGAVGLAILTNAYLAAVGGSEAPVDLVHGFATVFLCSSAVMVGAALIAVFVIRETKESSPKPSHVAGERAPVSPRTST